MQQFAKRFQGLATHRPQLRLRHFVRPRVLLLSAYDASSHLAWREHLQQWFPDYQWTCLTSPPRHFNWRIRGNSLLWGFAEPSPFDQQFDLLLATSMVDLASLRGFVPALGDIPSLVYFHENQFAYPAGQQRDENVEPLLVPIYSALCADRIVFNSQFNRTSFLEGANSLFKRLPDKIPSAVLEKLQSSRVLPVPLATRRTDRESQLEDRKWLEVVWNHRWEYDKGIELLLELVKQIHQQVLPIRLHIVGEQFRRQPEEFNLIDQLLEAHSSLAGVKRGAFGYLKQRQEYESLLASCDVVLSTSLHEFQGLALQEACLLGCTPLAPDALVYPEYLDPVHLYPLRAERENTAAEIRRRLEQWQADRVAGLSLPKALTDYDENRLRRQYAELFEELLNSR